MASQRSQSDAIVISRSTVQRVVVSLLVALVLVLAAALIVSLTRTSSSSPSTAAGGAAADSSLAGAVNPQRYQAVFLTNNEVYFGKLHTTTGVFQYMKHAYRLAATPNAARGQPTRQLVKITSDIHGPEDTIVINRAQILYVENLSPTGSAARLLKKSGA